MKLRIGRRREAKIISVMTMIMVMIMMIILESGHRWRLFESRQLDGQLLLGSFGHLVDHQQTRTLASCLPHLWT